MQQLTHSLFSTCGHDAGMKVASYFLFCPIQRIGFQIAEDDRILCPYSGWPVEPRHQRLDNQGAQMVGNSDSCYNHLDKDLESPLVDPV